MWKAPQQLTDLIGWNGTTPTSQNALLPGQRRGFPSPNRLLNMAAISQNRISMISRRFNGILTQDQIVYIHKTGYLQLCQFQIFVIETMQWNIKKIRKLVLLFIIASKIYLSYIELYVSFEMHFVIYNGVLQKFSQMALSPFCDETLHKQDKRVGFTYFSIASWSGRMSSDQGGVSQRFKCTYSHA